MALLRRRPRPPAEMLELLERDERVLSWADVEARVGGDRADGVLVATPLGLWWPFAEGPRRIAWPQIDKAVWRDGQLIVIEADVVDDILLVDRLPVAVRVVEPRDLPPTVRKRVEASVVRSEVAAISGGSARFVARRIPGRDGVTWWARLEPGTPDTPPARADIVTRIGELAQAWTSPDV